jgi:hypothetical protein
LLYGNPEAAIHPSLDGFEEDLPKTPWLFPPRVMWAP